MIAAEILTRHYCTPYDVSNTNTNSCWPDETQWQAFIQQLGNYTTDEEEDSTTKPKVVKVDPENYQTCIDAGDNAYKITKSADGICMQTHNCNSEYCNSDNELNLPAYTVRAEQVEDIQHVLEFCNEYDIAVTVKTSGHNYSGSSTAKDSVMIWMAHYEKYGDILVVGDNFTDSCGTTAYNNDSSSSSAIMKIGAGATWGDVYKFAGTDYNVIGGGGLTVSAIGGWLQGGGLSAMSRTYGIGIDNVVRFDVVVNTNTNTSNGTRSVVVADACSNPDLFWALRGGGGGTFGIVVAAYYKLHPVSSVTMLTLNFIRGGTEINTTSAAAAVCQDDNQAIADYFASTESKEDDFIQSCVQIALYSICGFFWAQCPVSCIAGCSSNQPDDATFVSTVDSFLDFWVEQSPFIDPRWGGYWTGTSLMLYFLGDEADAKATLREDVEHWIASRSSLEQSRIYLEPSVTHDSYWGARGLGESTDRTGSTELNLASRLVPRDWVIENKEAAKGILKDLVLSTEGVIVTSYLLGGAVADVPGNATAINPAMREAIWSVHTYDYDRLDDSYSQQLRDVVTNDITGACYNHASYKEPDWVRSFWGDNAQRLEELAKIYDPEKRLNCWHCIGYVDPDEEFPMPSSSPSISPSVSPSAVPSSSPTYEHSVGPSQLASREPTMAPVVSSSSLSVFCWTRMAFFSLMLFWVVVAGFALF